MQTLLEAYHTELATVAGFAPDTVENYEICLAKFFDFAANQLRIDPLEAGAKDLLTWMTHLKGQRLSRSRLTHHLPVRAARRQVKPPSNTSSAFW